jgi:mannose-6-phosphate isomerase-like protein (cupin superfamily)
MRGVYFLAAQAEGIIPQARPVLPGGSMPILLEGGCRVSRLREGTPEERGSLRIFRHVDRTTGASAISLRVLEFAPGLSPTLANASCDEILFVLAGKGVVLLDGQSYVVGPETGIYLKPGARLAVEVDGPAPEPLTMVSSRCPDPGPELAVEPPTACAAAPSDLDPAAPSGTGRPPLVRLSDRAKETTADRWYRVLLDETVGSAQVTQFVGGIPPGRAPDHYHEYEEVLCILKGQGRLWAGASNTPIEAGSCVFLPRRQVHCVENTGGGELRLLGVFYPAGSPAVRYAAD